MKKLYLKHRLRGSLLCLLLLLVGQMAWGQVIQPTPFYAMPNYGTNKVRLAWASGFHGKDYEYRVKKGTGSWSSWNLITQSEGQMVPPFPSAYASTAPTMEYVDIQENYDINQIYYFQLKCTEIPTNQPRYSDPIEISFKRVWPVADDNNCQSSADHLEVFKSFSQIYLMENLIGNGYEAIVHEGLDIRGAGKCVRSALGGIVFYTAQQDPSDQGVAIMVLINDSILSMSYNHISNAIYNHAVQGRQSVAAGTKLGTINNGLYHPIAHLHFSLSKALPDASASADIFLNPLKIWDDQQYNHFLDIKGIPPQISNTNPSKDQDSIYFIRNNTNLYLDSNTIAYGPIDIAAEVIDKKSSTPPWAIPKSFGYEIEKITLNSWSKIVQNGTSPYLLYDHKHYLGLENSGPPTLPTDLTLHSNLNNAIVEQNISYSSDYNPTIYYLYPYTYKVTNTKGSSGKIQEIDKDQCFATDVRNTITPQQSGNGYIPNYPKAREQQEARFPDGKYKINFILKDNIHTTIHPHQFYVDNFLPYLKQIEVYSGQDLIYSKDWKWNNNTSSLALIGSGVSGFGTKDQDLQIKVTASEGLKSLVIDSIASITSNGATPAPINGAPQLVSVSGDSTQWTFRIPAPLLNQPAGVNRDGMYELAFSGKDLAGNPLLGFSLNKTSYSAQEIPKHQYNGTWAPQPLASTTDRVHRFMLAQPCSNGGNKTAGPWACLDFDFEANRRELPPNGGTVSFSYQIDSLEAGTAPYKLTWFFGNGDSLVQANVSALQGAVAYQYGSIPAGTFYSVALKVVAADSLFRTKFKSNHIGSGLRADFSVNHYQRQVNQVFTFTDQSFGGSGLYSYDWDFGPGANPHTPTNASSVAVSYVTPGYKDIRLRITDLSTQNTSEEIKIGYIQAIDSNQAVPVTADFTPYTGTGLDVNFALGFAAGGCGSPYRLTWYFGDGSVDNGNNPAPYHRYASGGTYTVTLEVTDFCGLPQGGFRISKNITLVDSLIAEFEAPAIASSGIPITFNNRSNSISWPAPIDAQGNSGNYLYKWNFGDGNIATSDNLSPNISHTYSAPGTYTVRLVAEADVPSGLNSYSPLYVDTIQITQAGITLNSIHLNTTACVGLQINNGDLLNDPKVKFEVLTTPGNTVEKLMWSTSPFDPNQPSGPGNQYFFHKRDHNNPPPPQGNYENQVESGNNSRHNLSLVTGNDMEPRYTLYPLKYLASVFPTVYNGIGTGGLRATIYAYAKDASGNLSGGQWTLSLYDKLQVNISDAAACPGDSAQLFAQVSGGDGNYHYLWSDGGEDAARRKFSPPATQSYQARVNSNNNACYSLLATAEVKVEPLSVTLPDTMVVCLHNPGGRRLVAQVSGGSGSYAYNWCYNQTLAPNLPGIWVNNCQLENPLLFIEAEDTLTITLQVRDGNGCWTTASMVVIGRQSNPQALIAPISQQACEGEVLTLQVQRSGGILPYTNQSGWQALEQGAVVQTHAAPYWQTQATTDRLYRYQAVDDIGCVGVDSIFIQVHPNAVGTIQTQLNGPVCPGTAINLNATMSQVNGFQLSWKDSVSLQVVSPATTTTVYPAHPTVYCYQGSNPQTGCRTTIGCVPVAMIPEPGEVALAVNALYEGTGCGDRVIGTYLSANSNNGSIHHYSWKVYKTEFDGGGNYQQFSGIQALNTTQSNIYLGLPWNEFQQLPTSYNYIAEVTTYGNLCGYQRKDARLLCIEVPAMDWSSHFGAFCSGSSPAFGTYTNATFSNPEQITFSRYISYHNNNVPHYFFAENMETFAAIPLSNGDSLHLQGSRRILLKPGFHAGTGAKFTAKIADYDGCFGALPQGGGNKIEQQYNTNFFDEENENRKALQLMLYPNPTTGYTHLQYFLPENTNVTITLFDALLHHIDDIQSTQWKAHGIHQIEYDASTLPSGLYLIKIDDGKQHITKQLIIAR